MIDHPDPSKRTRGYKLKHCFVESPTRGDNLYRYHVTTQDGHASISLPTYFPFLNEDIQAWINPVNVMGYGFCKVSDDLLTVEVTSSVDGDYNVLIIGTRSDELARCHFDGEGGVEYVPKQKGNKII